jgi:hypothetical protein
MQQEKQEVNLMIEIEELEGRVAPGFTTGPGDDGGPGG